ncbi:flagellar biosynthetic protein FliO [Thalassolituus sp. LLYu03]|uniref:flagellar biosynthetic protein FliO n=1 Tax=Thalassolituus sp. LLYu03 TaxID=3421656 RepID=UPI003D2AEC86
MNVFSVCVKSMMVLGVMLSTSVMAADAALPAAPAPIASAGKVMFFLLITLVLIVGLAWIVSKTRGVQLAQGQGKVRVVATLPLGMKEKIAVIQVGDKQMVVGVTAQQITHLGDLDEPLALDAPAAAGSFQELLKKAIRS